MNTFLLVSVVVLLAVVAVQRYELHKIAEARRKHTRLPR